MFDSYITEKAEETLVWPEKVRGLRSIWGLNLLDRYDSSIPVAIFQVSQSLRF